MAELAERIEQLCLVLGEGGVYAYADQAGAGEVLARILDSVRTGTPYPDLEADLNVLDDAFARLGLGVVTQPERAYRPLPGTSGGHPVVQAWACPAPGRCSRVESVVQHPDPSKCEVTGQPLRLVRVAT